jgi:hypothetical protein
MVQNRREGERRESRRMGIWGGFNLSIRIVQKRCALVNYGCEKLRKKCNFQKVEIYDLF